FFFFFFFFFLAEGAPRRPQTIPPAARSAPSGPSGVRIGPFVLAAPTPITATDPMAEAGRKVLAVHFGRMLANEEGTRLGEDPEALHDMRVATRRMRAALALFAPYYKPKALKPLGKGLRRAGRTLGAVRDLDVLIGKARAYGERLAAEGRGDLTPLLEAWTAAREEARGRLLAYLDGAAYRRFVAAFTAFLVTPSAPLADPTASDQVRHVAPRLILERYEAVRSFERRLPDGDLATYHALRIECKGLRYALEFFRDVLGAETPALIKQVTAMQDLLGELQDARVAEQLLTSFLQEAATTADLSGVQTYLAAQQSRQRELLAAFPAPWADLIGPDFRRRLALAIAAL
ncbi:MAG: CHAD domain-containing protein, partial [Anaerolineae bacterium]|nr:CHAD domain-containing protein [Anaerolineae bacterium]